MTTPEPWTEEQERAWWDEAIGDGPLGTEPAPSTCIDCHTVRYPSGACHCEFPF